MKLSYHTTTFRNFKIDEAIRLIAAAGYNGVDMAMIDPHLHVMKCSDEQVRETKKLCDSLGLAVACVCVAWPNLLSETPYEPTIINGDAKGRQARIDSLKRTIEVAHMFDSPCINMVSGFPFEGVSPERSREYLLEGINTLLPELGKTVMAIEPEPDFFVETTTDAISVIKELNSPNFGLTMDIGHVIISEDDPYGAIERALPYTSHMHVEDIKDKVHAHLSLGEGDIDFKRVAAAIKAANYPHYISVELQNHLDKWQRALYESRDYLRELFRA